MNFILIKVSQVFSSEKLERFYKVSSAGFDDPSFQSEFSEVSYDLRGSLLPPNLISSLPLRLNPSKTIE